MESLNRELTLTQRKNENLVNILREELECERRLSNSNSRDSFSEEYSQDLHKKVRNLEDQLSEKERQLKIALAESKKEISVQSKKIEYLEAALEESASKEKQVANEMKKLKKDHFVEFNDSVLKYETSFKTLELKNKELMQKIFDLEVYIYILKENFHINKRIPF